MAARTYLPQLLFIMHRVCKYMSRYQVQIKSHLTAPQILLFDAVLEACLALSTAIGVLPVGD